MSKKNEIEALINLLDDSDEEVVRHVTEKLLSLGKDIIPLLDDIPFNDLNNVQHERLEEIKHQIHYDEVETGLEGWVKSGAKDLLEGFILASRFRYPYLDINNINNLLDKIKLDVWLELNSRLTPLEKIRKINYIFYRIYGFKGDIQDYHSPDNSFINKVLDNRRGNPISLAIVYSIICQKLGIPVFGVNLPQHFILAYKDDRKYPREDTLKGHEYLDPSKSGDVLFYVNAFNQGTIFSKWNIDQFLKQLKIQPLEMYYEPCSNVDIIMRVFRNLNFSYEKIKDENRANETKRVIEMLKPYASPIF